MNVTPQQQITHACLSVYGSRRPPSSLTPPPPDVGTISLWPPRSFRSSISCHHLFPCSASAAAEQQLTRIIASPRLAAPIQLKMPPESPSGTSVLASEPGRVAKVVPAGPGSRDTCTPPVRLGSCGHRGGVHGLCSVVFKGSATRPEDKGTTRVFPSFSQFFLVQPLLWCGNKNALFGFGSRQMWQM